MEKTHPYQTIWYHALSSPSLINYIHIYYHLVMTNSSPWKIPTINGGLVRWENPIIYPNHDFQNSGELASVVMKFPQTYPPYHEKTP
jgi:hypothetical protein